MSSFSSSFSGEIESSIPLPLLMDKRRLVGIVVLAGVLYMLAAKSFVREEQQLDRVFPDNPSNNAKENNEADLQADQDNTNTNIRSTGDAYFQFPIGRVAHFFIVVWNDSEGESEGEITQIMKEVRDFIGMLLWFHAEVFHSLIFVRSFEIYNNNNNNYYINSYDYSNCLPLFTTQFPSNRW